MSTDTNQTRMTRWRETRSGRIAGEIALYVGFALMRFYRDRGMQAAAALTYTTLLALVPMMAIAFAIFAAFPAFVEIRAQLEGAIFNNLVPEVGDQVRSYLNSFLGNVENLSAIGIVALAVSAVLLLSTIEATLNTIWRVERPRPILTRVLIFWSVLTLGPLLIGVSMSVTSDAFTIASEYVDTSGLIEETGGQNRTGVLDRLIAAVLQTIAFTALFVVVPARSVRVRDAFIGGAISGIGFELLKWGFSLYLGNFHTYQTIYGAMATVPIFLIWLYVSWTVVLLGAVFAASFQDWWQERNPGLLPVARTPGMQFDTAIAVLRQLHTASAKGDETEPSALTALGSGEIVDLIVERLRAKRYVGATEAHGLVLSRDLRRVTAWDLYRDLELAAVGGDDQASTPNSQTMTALAKAEREALDISLLELMESGDVRPGDVVPLATGSASRSQ